jgi:hypothetical protein
VVVSPCCPIAATDCALAVVNVVRQSRDCDGDCATVAAGTDGSGVVCHVIWVCLDLGFERERAEFWQMRNRLLLGQKLRPQVSTIVLPNVT